MAESLCCSSEMNTALLIGYTPKQNKKFKVFWEKKELESHTHTQNNFVSKDNF